MMGAASPHREARDGVPRVPVPQGKFPFTPRSIRETRFGDDILNRMQRPITTRFKVKGMRRVLQSPPLYGKYSTH